MISLADARLLLVPGLGLTARAWEPTIRALRTHGLDGDRVEVAHLPGYGRPPRSGDADAPLESGRLLVARCLRGRAGARPTVLVGHSASCQVVAHAAALAPELVAGLVLVGPTTDPRARTWPRIAARWLRTAAHEPPAQVPSLLRQWSRTGFGHMARTMDAARSDRIDHTLQEVSCRVLLLRGPRDRISPSDWLAVLAEAGPGGRRTAVTLDRGAHMVPLVHGDLVAREIVERLMRRAV